MFEDPAGLNYETDYQYDTLDNLLRVDQKGSAPTDSTKWRTRTFTYDSLSRPLTASNPESGTTCYGTWSSGQCVNGYDANGNLLSLTNNRNIITTNSYDALNRLTQKSFSNGDPTLYFSYDSYTGWSSGSSIGRLVRTGQNNYLGRYFAYDTLGRVTGTWQCLPSNCTAGAGVSAQYNLAGGLTQLTYPNGQTLTYAQDSAGRNFSAIDTTNNINFATGATYGPGGWLSGFASGQAGSFAGITNTFVYDKRLQLCRVTASSTGAVPINCTASFGNLLDLQYSYNLGNGDNGNVTQITNWRDQTRNQTFTYDALNRLSSAQNAGTDCSQTVLGGLTKFWGNSYGYDAWGNLLSKSVTKCSSEPLNVTADAQNRLHVISGTDYSYDAAGNMTHDATGNHNYAYDAQSHITQVDAGNTATYTYDAEGNRLRKDVAGSASTEYVYFNGQAIAEKNVTSGAWTNYVFFNGARVARQDANGVRYYLSDHLNSAAVITDAAANSKAEMDFFPWGGELQFSNNDSNHYIFTSDEHDAETNVEHTLFRQYSSPWAAGSRPTPREWAPPTLLIRSRGTATPM